MKSKTSAKIGTWALTLLWLMVLGITVYACKWDPLAEWYTNLFRDLGTIIMFGVFGIIATVLLVIIMR